MINIIIIIALQIYDIIKFMDSRTDNCEKVENDLVSNFKDFWHFER